MIFSSELLPIVAIAFAVYYLLLPKTQAGIQAAVGARPLLRFVVPANENVRLIMAVIVTVLVLPTALYIILCHSCSEEDRNHAWEAIATILAFWLARQWWPVTT